MRDLSDYKRTLMPQLIQVNEFDWIELDVSKKDGSWKPATKLRAAPTSPAVLL